MFPIHTLPDPSPYAVATPPETTPAACPEPETPPKRDGTGPHLGLRRAWYNDLSHDITDNTLFRLLLIALVIDWFYRRVY